MDAHAKSINVAVILPGSKKADEQWQVANEERSLKRLAKKLKALAPGEIRSAYEAGPCGYALQRRLQKLGIGCDVIAPSLIPVKPGERVKTDKRDARKLAQLHRSGLLTVVQPPTEDDEAVRDLMRAREDAKKDLMSARHRIRKMLIRYGLRFDGTKNWTKKHNAWLKRLRFDQLHAQQVLDNYLFAMEQIEDRIDRLDADVKAAATEEAYAERVGWLRCFRGVDTVVAMTILAELHDFRRFASPRDLMAYLGLTPSEYSSGKSVHRGGITKTGNSHVRRMVIQSGWCYRFRATVSGELKKRREGQPPEIIALADRAQMRLHRRYIHLKEDLNKPHNVVNVAIARELVGFVWAAMQYESASSVL